METNDFLKKLHLEAFGLEEVKKSESREIEIKKADEEKKLVYGVVIEPMTEVTKDGDAHGDRMTAEEIEKTAHGYMKNHQNVKLQHQGGNVNATVVESYIAPADFTVDEEVIKKGSWVMVTKVESDLLWTAIKKNLITGYSPGGMGVRNEIGGDDD